MTEAGLHINYEWCALRILLTLKAWLVDKGIPAGYVVHRLYEALHKASQSFNLYPGPLNQPDALIDIDALPFFFDPRGPMDFNLLNRYCVAEPEMDPQFARTEIAPIAVETSPLGLLAFAEDSNTSADARSIIGLSFKLDADPGSRTIRLID